MIIRDTDTKTLREALALLRADHSLNHSARVDATLAIKIKAIEITLAERTA